MQKVLVLLFADYTRRRSAVLWTGAYTYTYPVARVNNGAPSAGWRADYERVTLPFITSPIFSNRITKSVNITNNRF